MAEQLMGLSPLGALRIDADLIELQVSVAAHQDPARRRFRLHAEQGTVCFGRRLPKNPASCCRWTRLYGSSRPNWGAVSWASKATPASRRSAGYRVSSGWQRAMA